MTDEEVPLIQSGEDSVDVIESQRHKPAKPSRSVPFCILLAGYRECPAQQWYNAALTFGAHFLEIKAAPLGSTEDFRLHNQIAVQPTFRTVTPVTK